MTPDFQFIRLIADLSITSMCSRQVLAVSVQCRALANARAVSRFAGDKGNRYLGEKERLIPNSLRHYREPSPRVQLGILT